MYKEGVEHIEYEEALVRLTNIDSRYGYLFTTNKFSNQSQLAYQYFCSDVRRNY